MDSLDVMVALLVKALREPQTRRVTVKQLQSLVWDIQEPRIGKDIGQGQGLHDVFADLAYDLDFFEADPVVRSESASYYGHERLEEEIHMAVRRLAALGVDVPHDPLMGN